MTNSIVAYLDKHIAAGQGGRTAIVTPTGSHTYAEVLAASCRAGNALRRLGVEPEQRVAMLLADGLPFVATFFGTLRIGAVAVPLNTRLRAEDYAALLRDSRAKVLVADAAAAEGLRGALAGLPHLRAVVTAEPCPGFPSLDRLCARAAPALGPEPVSGDDMAFWLYTSGTTGVPKGAIHLHRDHLACHHYADDVLGVTAEDRVLATSRLFFAYALGNSFLLPFFAGARTFLDPAWPDPAAVAENMLRFEPTILFSVPTFFARLLRADPPPAAFRSLRFAVSAGERLPAELYRVYRDRFGLEILDGIGATETVFMVISNRPGQSRPGSTGTPVPGTDVRLLDAGGREVGDGEEGILHVRTGSASPGYWNRLERSRATFIGEWFRTGDVYRRDADGFYYHCGREDDFFKVAGMWVAPADVETALLSHPGVAEAGAVGSEEGSGLVKCFAFVVPKDETKPADELVAELRELAESTLAPHQRPRKIVVVPELPRTATGKLQRFVLKANIR
ncbi:MAG: benzoate-CoA ligase family protein [Candidatus Rokubacteria bacterium]|nr:benzoate-CoA ligase family protein [Candidatus Rokubacteria bacterium]